MEFNRKTKYDMLYEYIFTILLVICNVFETIVIVKCDIFCVVKEENVFGSAGWSGVLLF